MAETDRSMKWAKWIGTYTPPVLALGAIVVVAVPTASGMIFGGGSKKVARLELNDPIVYAIGAAEGTRTCDGGKTEAYKIHRDPSDKKTNAGTFSAAPRGNGITANMSPEDRDKAYLEGQINPALKQIDTSKMNRLELATFVDLRVQAHPSVSEHFAKSSGPGIVARRVDAFQGESWTTRSRLTADQQRRTDRIKECLGVS